MNSMAGGYYKLDGHQITAYWDTLGEGRDFGYWSQVGTWIGKNNKVLNKKRDHEICQLVAEQFPDVQIVECKDFSGRCARVSR